MKLTRSRSGRERGQVLVLTALMLAVLIGAVGLSVDIGFMMHTRTELQKDADAMALAGAPELCVPVPCGRDKAEVKAREWGVKNDVTVSDVTDIQFGVDCDGGSGDYLITVRVKRYQASFFARVLGFTGSDIGACATAGKFGIGSLSGARPFALDVNCLAQFNISYNSIVTLHQDSGTQGNVPCDKFRGNYSELSIDGTGSAVYRDTIKYGSKSTICSTEVPECTNYAFDTNTGTNPGPLRQGLDYVLNNTPTNCDTWDEAVQGQGADEVITPACNPWRSDYTGLSTRLWIIPIVNTLVVSGTKTVNIVSFAKVFLENVVCDAGNNCDLKARFIESTVSLPGDDRIALNSGSAVTAVVLIK